MIAELKETKKYLKINGIKSANIEAEDIFCHLLDCRIIDLYTLSLNLDENKKKEISRLTQRRVNGEPLQYILQKTYFYGNEFKLQKGVFIPRPETEILVSVVLSYLNDSRFTISAKGGSALGGHDSRKILDLCTGCGNIPISLTKASPYYKIFASDIVPQATKLAQDNAGLNNVTHDIDFRCGNLFEPWMDKKKFFDFIICNPPYIKTNNLIDLSIEVKNEPKEALDGGVDGLLFYRMILKQAPGFLKEKAYIAFEVAPDIVDGVKEILKDNFCDIEVIKDYNNLDRVIIARII